jgi:hypothetical protein
MHFTTTTRRLKMALITKLESAVNDDTLLPLGVLVLHSKEVDSPTAAKRFVGINGNVTMKIVGDGYFTDSSLTPTTTKEVSFTGAGEHGVYTSNGNYKIYCTMKYDFTRLALNGEGVYIDIDENKFVPACTEIVANSTSTKGNIENLKDWAALKSFRKNGNFACLGLVGNISVFADKSSIERVNLQMTNVEGSLSVFADKTSIGVLSFLDSKGIYGNVSELAGLVNATTINLNGCNKVVGRITSLGALVSATFIGVQSTSVTGSNDDLAAALAASGKTSGSVRIIDASGSDKTYDFPLT